MKTFTTLVSLLFTAEVLFAQGSTNLIASGNNPRIQLSIQGNILKDQTVVAFAPSATSHFDNAYDSIKQFSTNTMAPAISSVLSSLDLCINTLPSVPLSAIVPIRVKVGATGKYFVSADSISGMPAGSCVYLEDRATGTMTNLNASPVNAFIIDDTTTAPRFLLHVSQPLSLAPVAVSCLHLHDGKAIISGAGTWASLWQNAAGDTMAIHTSASGGDTLSGLSHGLYTVLVIGNTSCSTMADTFMVDDAVPMSVNAVVGNMICKGSFGSIDASNVSGGQAPYTYQWSNGTTNPQAQHLSAGLYALFVTDAKGCTDTSTYNVQQLSHLNVGFSSNTDTLMVSDPTVVFTDSSSGQTSLSWNFGDGSTLSDVYNTSHTYGGQGTYTVTLIANDAYCSDTAQRVISVLNTTSIHAYDLNNTVTISNTGEGAAVKFNLQTEEEGMILVYAIDGKLISSKHVRAYSQTETISLGDAAGMYLVQVEIKGESIIKKITK